METCDTANLGPLSGKHAPACTSTCKIAMASRIAAAPARPLRPPRPLRSYEEDYHGRGANVRAESYPDAQCNNDDMRGELSSPPVPCRPAPFAVQCLKTEGRSSLHVSELPSFGIPPFGRQPFGPPVLVGASCLFALLFLFRLAATRPIIIRWTEEPHAWCKKRKWDLLTDLAKCTK